MIWYFIAGVMISCGTIGLALWIKALERAFDGWKDM